MQNFSFSKNNSVETFQNTDFQHGLFGFSDKRKGTGDKRGPNILQASVYKLQMRTKKVLILFQPPLTCQVFLPTQIAFSIYKFIMAIVYIIQVLN